MKQLVRTLSLLSMLLTANLNAQDLQPINNERDTSATPLSPDQAAAAFQLLEGLTCQVFAAEPAVQNPIAMTWDGMGRLWIAENYTYSDHSQRFDLSHRDRIIILSDRDGDGHHDHRQVFSDQLQVLTSVEVGHGGVWALCPPELIFIPDATLNGQPDGPARIVLDGFTVGSENYHNFANGLKWGPDGWLYGRCGGSCPGQIGIPGTVDGQRVPLEGGLWRYHVHRQVFEVLAHGTTNPWGHDWDSWGECFFINTVNGHLWHLIVGSHLDRPFTLDPNPYVYELLDTHSDHWHFDTGKAWFTSRDGSASDFGGGHAHVGMMIYQADDWPSQLRNRLMTWNIHGQRVNQEVLHRVGSGYVGRHAPDILQASDPFFRGMDLSTGPDGAVYAIDWSDTGECHENTGVHRTSGRVFRFSASKKTSAQAQSSAISSEKKDLRALSSIQLAQLHEHRNQWYVRQARLILAERAKQTSDEPGNNLPDDLQAGIEQLRKVLSGTNDQLAYQALMTLHAMEACSSETLLQLLDHSNEHLRTWAVRLLLDNMSLDDIFGRNAQRADIPAEWIKRLTEQAENDASGLVRLALASAMQRFPLDQRFPIAAALMHHTQDANDHNLPLQVWYGLIPAVQVMPLEAAQLTAESKWPRTVRLIARRLSSGIDTHPQAVDRLLEIAKRVPGPIQLAIFQGISQGLKGYRKLPAPPAWSALASSIASVESGSTDSEPGFVEKQELLLIVRELNLLFGDGRTLDQTRTLVLDQQADPELRLTALQALVRSQPDDLLDICLPLLKDSRLNVAAAQGLSGSADLQVAEQLVKNYQRFRAPERPGVISLFVARRAFAQVLLEAIADGSIHSQDLTPYDVRQIRSHGDVELDKRIKEVWGQIGDTPEDKKRQIESLRQLLTQNPGLDSDPSRGRQIFQQRCGSCHRLFGSGQKIGPDLTGANRQNLDYWLENIVAPSLIVSKDYTMSVVELQDGRVLNGLIVNSTQQSLQLQTPTELLTLSAAEVQQTAKTELSPMPDGLLDNLSEQQIRDLFEYLRTPAQVPLPEP
jgi:putative membrane-bound dehydrogenase-like protein